MDGWKILKQLSLRQAVGRLSLLLLSLALTQTAPAYSQVETATPDPETHYSYEAKLSNLWSRYKQAKQADDEAAQEKTFKDIQAIGSVASAEVFELGGYLFLDEGFKDLEEKNYEHARREFLQAAQLNPYLWAAFDGLAHIKLDRGEGIRRYLRLTMKGMNISITNQNAWFMLDALSWLINIVAMGIMILMVLISAVLCLKYTRQFLESTINAFEEKHLDELYARLLAIGVLCLPLLLGLNLYLVASLYLALFFPFFEARERIATLMLFISPLTLPILSHLDDNIRDARVDPHLKAHLSQYTQGDIETQIQFLETNPGRDELGHLSILVGGLLQKAKGDLRNSLDTFSKMPATSHWAGHALINKGNIRYLAKEFQEALETYRQATGLPSIRALAAYNQSVVKSMQGMHDDAEQLRTQAMRLDPALEGRVNREGGWKIMDALPNNKDRLLKAVFTSPGDFTAQFVSRYLPYALFSIVLLLSSLIHLRTRNMRLLAKSCDKCGRLFYPSDSPESDWCSQCVTLYITKEDLPSVAKMRKHEEVARFNKRKRYLFTLAQLLMPGARKLMTGNAISGLITLTTWVFLVLFCVYPITTIAHVSMRFLQEPVLLTWVSLCITIVYWLIFGLRAWQED